LSAVLPSDTSPDEITSSRLLKKAGPVLKIARKGSVAKKQLSFFITEEANSIEEKRKKQRGNKIQDQRNRNCKQPKYLRSAGPENEKN